MNCISRSDDVEYIHYLKIKTLCDFNKCTIVHLKVLLSIFVN